MDAGLVPSPTVTLESRYTEFDRPVLLSGVQALVRIMLEQARLDRLAGLNTGGLVSGYRGSPLGGVDQELWRREALLQAANVRFQPGLNEDLAATMLWGSQQIDTFPGKTVDGVFGMWYGKGPGVDRSGDAFRCANTIGTARHGGVLAVSGDDHAAHSSVFPHQTDGIFQAVNIPVLCPADVQDILDYGLAGIALSRFCGLWVGLKTIAETAEQHGLAVVPTERRFVTPDFALPPHGLNLDPALPWPGQRRELERRVLQERFPALLAWVRANRLDRQTQGSAIATVGIVTVGKAHHDMLHALRHLGLHEHPAIAVYKVGMIWPLETQGLREFAQGKQMLVVVEEKRSLVEMQVRDALYNLVARPLVVGKTGHDGSPLLPAELELSPELLMAALARVLPDQGVAVAAYDPPALPRDPALLTRAPMFCAGCPHNTSTVLPDGSHAMAGIGCHTMAVSTNPDTRTFSQMGGEGVPWIGLAPFTSMPHMFANMGDGTYQHSGLLAIRQALAARVRITYKILYNDAVAMTGGQPAEGSPSVTSIARQLHAEGIRKLAIVADDVARLPPASEFPPGATRHGREELDAVQREMREYDGVSAILYDQVCATEKRRRRKRGKMAAAETHVTINPEVCENCGDCTAQSNCIAIEPVETDHGRKRRISPTSCNTDLSCLKGFCPSFVTTSSAAPVTAFTAGHAARWMARETGLAADLPAPAPPVLVRPWRGLFAGIGGGGIVTCSAIVAVAAHVEGRAVSTLDFTGLAQKNGAVVSHVQIAPDGALDVVRIPVGEGDMLLGADLAVAADPDVLGRCSGRAVVIGNLDLPAGAAFLHDRDLRVDAGLHRRAIERHTDRGASRWLRGSLISERLFGTAQAVNTLLLGMAWQLGQLPLQHASLMRAIALNGTAVAVNERAFLWGRILVERPELAGEILADTMPLPDDLASVIERRTTALVEYGGHRIAHQYVALVDAVSAREQALAGAPGPLTRAVAEGAYRTLALKDEYEVARLHAAATYGENAVFHLAPPLSGMDPATGRRRKRAIPGRVALPLFRLLRHGKVLRGTPFDVFGWQAERRAERVFARQYEADLRAVLPGLSPATLDAAVALARQPIDIRGFGPVKEAAFAKARLEREALLDRLASPLAEAAD